TRGQAAGTVRSGRHPAHRRRSRPAHPAPALAGWPAAAGDPRPARVLGPHLPGGAQGNEGSLSEAPVAGRSVERHRDPSGEAAWNLAARSFPASGEGGRCDGSAVPAPSPACGGRPGWGQGVNRRAAAHHAAATAAAADCATIGFPPRIPPMSRLDSISGKMMDLVGQVGDSVRHTLPDGAGKWLQAGMALGAAKTGSRAVGGVLRRNPAVLVAAAVGIGAAWYAVHRY